MQTLYRPIDFINTLKEGFLKRLFPNSKVVKLIDHNVADEKKISWFKHRNVIYEAAKEIDLVKITFHPLRFSKKKWTLTAGGIATNYDLRVFADRQIIYASHDKLKGWPIGTTQQQFEPNKVSNIAYVAPITPKPAPGVNTLPPNIGIGTTLPANNSSGLDSALPSDAAAFLDIIKMIFSTIKDLFSVLKDAGVIGREDRVIDPTGQSTAGTDPYETGGGLTDDNTPLILGGIAIAALLYINSNKEN